MFAGYRMSVGFASISSVTISVDQLAVGASDALDALRLVSNTIVAPCRCGRVHWLLPPSHRLRYTYSVSIASSAFYMTSYRAEDFKSRMEFRRGHGELAHRPMPIPDLRFEKNYVKSVRPYVHVDWSAHQSTALVDKTRAAMAGSETGSEVVHVDWGKVLWITVRDQVLSPFLQGALW